MATYYTNNKLIGRVYKKASQIVSEYYKNIYDEVILDDIFINQGLNNIQRILIKDLINKFIKSHPRPVEENPQNNQTYLRRSPRLANKPTIKYYTQQDEYNDIAEAIHTVCDKKGWVFTDDLVTDFYDYLSSIPKSYEFTKLTYRIDKFGYRISMCVPKTKSEVAKDWTLYKSTNIIDQDRKLQLNKAIIKYCNNHNFIYTPLMNDKFAQWMALPPNSDYFKKYYYDYTPYQYVKKWFSTLTKSVIL